MKNLLDEIFAREIARLDEISKERPLNMDEIKALETLTRALKSYQAPTVKSADPLEGLTTEQLLEIVGGDNGGRHTAEPGS